METIRHIVDDARGIYIPNHFYENFDLPLWGLGKDEIGELSDVDHDSYWDAWEHVINFAKFHGDDGHTWTLYHNEGLFAVRDDHEWEEEA